MKFRPIAVAAILSLAATAAKAADLDACLDSSDARVPHFEAAKQALIGNNFAEFWSVIDPAGTISEVQRAALTANFRNTVGNRAPVGCFLMQRNDFSADFVSEVFLVDFPGTDLFVALYAYRNEAGWQPRHYRMDSDFAEMLQHLK